MTTDCLRYQFWTAKRSVCLWGTVELYFSAAAPDKTILCCTTVWVIFIGQVHIFISTMSTIMVFMWRFLVFFFQWYRQTESMLVYMHNYALLDQKWLKLVNASRRSLQGLIIYICVLLKLFSSPPPHPDIPFSLFLELGNFMLTWYLLVSWRVS